MHDGFQHLVNADALLGADQHGVLGVESDHLLDLLANSLRLGGGEVDFIDHRDDFQVMMKRQVGVGQRLRFHALRGVHHQQRAFAGLQAA